MTEKDENQILEIIRQANYDNGRNNHSRILLYGDIILTLANPLKDDDKTLYSKTFAYNIEAPYYSMYGWVGTVIIFFLYFSVDYQKICKRYEYLNTQLKNEVGEQTSQLKEANDRLEHEMEIDTYQVEHMFDRITSWTEICLD